MAKGAGSKAVGESNETLRRHVRILVDLGRLMSQKVDLDSFLDQAVLHVARAVEIDHVKLMRYRPERADLLAVAGTGWKAGVIGHAHFPVNLKSAPGRAYRTGEPVLIDDISKAPEFKLSPVLVEHGIVALANVPIPVDGASWGVLEVDSTESRDFSSDTLGFLTATATLLGAAIQRDALARTEAEKLAAALAEVEARELLLAEVHHRVKNNLQIIISMIAMQKRRAQDMAPERAFDHIVNRIHAISIAHEHLDTRQGARTVPLGGYLRALCEAIGQQFEDITIDIDADEIDLLIDRAVPVGLILNETVTNSAKHGFSGGGGKVTVRLTAGVGIGEARLSVSDNGQGTDPSRPKGTGSRLIASLAAQIGGKVHEESSAQGTTTTLEFPAIS